MTNVAKKEFFISVLDMLADPTLPTEAVEAVAQMLGHEDYLGQEGSLQDNAFARKTVALAVEILSLANEFELARLARVKSGSDAACEAEGDAYEALTGYLEDVARPAILSVKVGAAAKARLSKVPQPAMKAAA